MKEKVLAILASSILMISLTACGGDKDDSDTSGVSDDTSKLVPVESQTIEVQPETMEARRHIELSDVYDAILAAQPEGVEPLEMTPEDGYSELVERLYPDMARFDYNQMILYAPPESGYPCEIMLVEAKYEIDADHAEDVFLDRIDKGAADGAHPENAEGWIMRAEVQRDGFYVAMIVLPEGYEIPDNVFYLI